MSDQVHNSYQSALLAYAAYVTTYDPSREYAADELSSLLQSPADLEVPFSEESADSFAARYEFIHHKPNDETGFSATVFRDRQTGQYVFALRGTDALLDVSSYLDIAGGAAGYQIISMLNYYQRLVTPADQQAVQVEIYSDNGQLRSRTFYENGLGEIPAGASMSVTGHSLGGHLSAAFAYAHPELIVAGYSYNGPGVGPGLGALLGLVSNDLGLNPGHGAAGSFLNLNAENDYVTPPAELVTAYLNGEHTLFSEGTHGMSEFADALAVCDLLAFIDPTLELGDASAILAAAAGYPNNDTSLEGIIETLSEIVLGDDGSIEDREAMYERMLALRQSIQQRTNPPANLSFRIESLVGDAYSLAGSAAAEGPSAGAALAYRFALSQLNPFAVFVTDAQGNVDQAGTAALYSDHASTLSLYDTETGQGTLTTTYLRQRSTYFGHVLEANTADDVDGLLLPASGGGVIFEDRTTGSILRITAAGPDRSLFRNVIFGADNPLVVEPIEGGSLEDYLFGGVGSDVLIGNSGNDYLEGGAGADQLRGEEGDDTLIGMQGNDILNGGAGKDVLDGGLDDDTYIIVRGESGDTIRDVGGDDTIIFRNTDGSDVYKPTGGNLINATLGVGGSTVYRSEDERSEYILSQRPDGSQRLTIFHGSDQVIIEDFEEGDFGITFDETPPAEPETTNTILGDLEPANDPPQYDALGNVIVGDTPAPGREDALFDSTGDDRIEAGGGNDWIRAFRGGNDHIDGGDGDDIVSAGDGDDVVEGGAGSDILLSGTGEDWLYGGYALDDPDAPATGLRGDYLAGYVGNNYLIGSTGNDVITGGSGDDLLVGGAGNDNLWGDNQATLVERSWDLQRSVTTGPNGNSYNTQFSNIQFETPAAPGNDTLLGGAGDDWIHGEDGHDYLDGGDGADLLVGDAGDDVLIGGDGDDVLIADNSMSNLAIERHGNDYLDGGAGNDSMQGGGFSDVLLGGAGNDRLDGDSSSYPAAAQGDDHLDGGDGDDQLLGWGGNDTLLGGAGNDILQSGEGDDEADGGEGADILFGEAGNDTLLGGAGADQLQGGDGNDVLNGGTDDDHLFGEAGTDALIGGDGNDWLQAGDGDDALDGGAGNDVLLGEAGADRLSGGAGADEIQGNDGDDVLDGGADADMLFGQAGNDSLSGGDGADQLQGGEGDDALVGGAGNDLLFGQEGADSLTGGAGDDQLTAGDGNDTLDGGEGRDILQGEAGNDALSGGGGDDELQGGDGNDALDGGADNDRLFGQNGADTLSGGGGNDRLFGGDGNDVLDGGVGDDVLSGESGADTLTGGSGNDQMSGGDGDDTLDGGDGVDLLWGSAGNDILTGGLGNDELRGELGDDTVSGGDGDDRLQGGAGTDTLIGGNGADRYYVTWGDGEDTIVDSGIYTAGSGNQLYFTGAIKVSDLRLGIGSLAIYIGDQGDVIHIEGFDPENPYANPVIETFVFEDGTTLGWNEFIDTIGLTMEGTPEDDVLTGTAAVDNIFGLAGNDRLDGGAGADRLHGQEGDDVYVLGAGDTVYELANQGHDTIEAAFSVTLADQVEDLTLLGTAALNGTGNGLNNTLRGTSGSNVLDGGAGADTMIGYAGNDTYRVNQAEDVVVEAENAGTDIVIVGAGSYTLAANVENLRLEGSATLGIGNALNNVMTSAVSGPAELRGEAGNDELIGSANNDSLYGGDGTDTLTGNAGLDVLDGGAGADSLRGGTGNDTYYVDNLDTITELTNAGTDTVVAGFNYVLATNLENLRLVGPAAFNGTGNSANNQLFGNELDNQLYGLGGVDRLEGGAGDDYLDGGQGADVILGGAGNDRLVDRDTGSDQMFGGAGDDTYLVDGGTTVTEAEGEGVDTVETISSFYGLSDNVENLIMLASGANYASGNRLDNHITGGSGPNEIYGDAGNDTLIGSTNDDLLIGGQGDDILDGGDGGNDTYVIDSLADEIRGESEDTGIDTIISALDTYVLGELFENLQLFQGPYGNGQYDSYSAGIAGFGNALDNDILGNWLGNTLYGLDGDDTVDGWMGNDALYGEDGNDNLYGGDDDFAYEPAFAANDVAKEAPSHIAGEGPQGAPRPQDWSGGSGSGPIGTNDDLLDGGLGDDILDGGSANDTLYGGAGNDELFGGIGGIIYEAGDDLLDGGEGDDLLDGGSGSDELQGGDGNDRLFGGLLLDNRDDRGEENDGDDRLYGGAGEDELDGGYGNDILDGGVGIDVMSGGTGDDIFYVDGQAEIEDDVVTLDVFCHDTRSFNLLRVAGYEADVVIEEENGGYDIVYSTVWMPTPDNVEEFHYVGAGPAILTGGDGDDILVGSGGDDVLYGVAGEDYSADNLIGGNGNDIYVLDSDEHVVIEDENGGVDVTISYASLSLFDNVENGVLLGEEAELLVGNELDNELIANDADNNVDGQGGNDLIDAGAGADWIYGGYGNDHLFGGDGADTFEFALGDGHDIVQDYADGNVIFLYNGEWDFEVEDQFNYIFTAADVRIEQTADGLLIRYGMEGDQILVRSCDPTVNPETVVQHIEFADGTIRTIDSYFNGNQPPVVADPIPDQQTLEDEVYSYEVPAATFADTDLDDSVTLSATLADGSALPDWLSFDAETGLFSGTPLNEHVGTLSLTVTAVDQGGLSASDTFVLDVINVNDAPTLEIPVDNQQIGAQQPFELALPDGTFDDVDVGDVLTYTAILADGASLPGWLHFDAETLTFTGTPGSADTGNLNVRVIATDLAGANAQAPFQLTVGSGQIIGTHRNDKLKGTSGNDVIDGRGGADVMIGGNGDDIYYVDTACSEISCDCSRGHRGNEGVGNGEDPPPPGHDDNYNDGPGTSPGNPGHGNGRGGGRGKGGYGQSAGGHGGGGSGNGGQGNGNGGHGNGNDGHGNGNGGNGGGNHGNGNGNGGNGNGNGNGHGNGGNGGNGNGHGNGGNHDHDDDHGDDCLADEVIENVGGGRDTVYSSVTYALADNVEVLRLVGTAALDGRGNALSNEIYGNDAANGLDGAAGADELHGAGGNDRLTGGVGNDILDGGSGNDTYCYRSGDGLDVIEDAAGTDTLSLEGVNRNRTTVRRVQRDGLQYVEIRFTDNRGRQISGQGIDILCVNGNSPIEWITFDNGQRQSLGNLIGSGKGSAVDASEPAGLDRWTIMSAALALHFDGAAEGDSLGEANGGFTDIFAAIAVPDSELAGLGHRNARIQPPGGANRSGWIQ